jgi:hypothetical protein
MRTSGDGTSTVWENRPTSHHNDVADVRIEQGDESAFLERVRIEIERQLKDTGYKIGDEGSGNDHYSLSYSDGTTRGWLDLWGVRTSADGYRVIITISEY